MSGRPAPTSFADLDAAVQRSVGARLFTVLHWSPAGRVLTRIHSDHPAEYPVGGRKTVEVDAGWLARCVERGEPWLGADVAAVRAVFADHALIERLGCGAAMNAPVVVGGRVMGVLNALDAEGAYDEAALSRLVAIADTAGDLVLRHAPDGGPP